MSKGIKCPNCGESDNYGSHQGGPGKGDDRWERRKKCKGCGSIFSTLEVPIGIIEAKTVPVAPAQTTAEPAAPVAPVAPVVQTEVAAPAPAVNNIFAPKQ